MKPDGREPRSDSGERGSAPAEFVMVAGLLIALTLGVLQLGAVLLVRNTVLDAAAEGARWAALAGNTSADGVARTREQITTGLGARYARNITASEVDESGQTITQITVEAPLPAIGFFGAVGELRVSGHAVLEPAP